MIAQCYMCGRSYAVPALRERQWLEHSDGEWDPTDWECPACEEAQERLFEQAMEELLSRGEEE